MFLNVSGIVFSRRFVLTYASVTMCTWTIGNVFNKLIDATSLFEHCFYFSFFAIVLSKWHSSRKAHKTILVFFTQLLLLRPVVPYPVLIIYILSFALLFFQYTLYEWRISWQTANKHYGKDQNDINVEFFSSISFCSITFNLSFFVVFVMRFISNVAFNTKLCAVLYISPLHGKTVINENVYKIREQ